jgi:hypothetical protein
MAHNLSVVRERQRPAQVRQPYSMSTATRINAVAHHNRKVEVPSIVWQMAMMHLALNSVTVLGRFESPTQAILFGMTGVIRFGQITPADILSCESRAGFFRRLGETEISHLLTSHSLMLDINREAHRLSLARIEDDFEVEVEDSVLTLSTGRLFR